MTIPTNGLVFYAPLAENADCAYTLTNSGSVTFQTFGGRQCAYFDGSSALYNNSFQVADAFTFSFHAYFQSGDCLFALGPWTNSHNMEVMTNNGYPRLYTYKNGSDENLIDATTNIKDGWHHIACTYDGTTQKLYVDGNLSASRTFSATIGAGIALGTNFTSSGSIGRDTKMTGYLAACRVYNRALSDSEITELSKEFSTTGGSLDTVLSALDGARDALVTAINAKGGSLADNATLYQCADAVGSLSGGTSAEYYKCASVDTSAKTWSGYEAVFDSGTGMWSFESDVTAGLAYTSVTPVVGGIYSADALVKVEYLYTSASFFDGFTFEDQLASTNGYLSLEESPTPVYVEHDNGKALSFDGSGGRELTGFDFIKNEFKIEFDFKIDSWSTDSSWKGNASRIFGAGKSDNTIFTFEAYKSNGEIKTCGFYTGFIVQLATWHHASVEYKNNKLTVTFDSNTVSFDYNPDLSVAQTYVNLGGSTFDNFYLLTGAIDNFNLYTFKA